MLSKMHCQWPNHNCLDFSSSWPEISPPLPLTKPELFRNLTSMAPDQTRIIQKSHLHAFQVHISRGLTVYRADVIEFLKKTKPLLFLSAYKTIQQVLVYCSIFYLFTLVNFNTIVFLAAINNTEFLRLQQYLVYLLC